jgi:hypothetical protein
MRVYNRGGLPIEKTKRTPFAPLSGNGRCGNNGLKNETREQAQKKEKYCTSSATMVTQTALLSKILHFAVPSH